MGRILYECLDLQVPAGGVRRLYRHVEILRKHGFDARILHHAPSFQTPWFKSDAVIDHWTSDYVCAKDDILVIPEAHVNVMRQSRNLPCKRVVIALGWGSIFRNLSPGETWHDFNISGVIAGGVYEAEFIQSTMGMDATIIRSGIDSTLFVPSPEKRCSIACMPRKNADYLHVILAGFRAKYPSFADVPFEQIDMIPHAEVAPLLSKSAIFLAHTFPEGLSRKTLEAMACGAIVVGFDGRGSAECMKGGVNCFRAPDGDLLQVIDDLAAAVKAFKEGTSAAMSQAAIKTAREYSLAREEKSVVAYWREFIDN